MRLSTSGMYQQSLNNLLSQQSALNSTQNQVSTGQRINVASDDPAGAGQVVQLKHILAANAQYSTNIDSATARLSTEQSALTSINGLLDSARTLALQGGNGSLNAGDRKDIASQLAQLRDQLVQLTNSTDANGNALFAGTSTTTAPFNTQADGSVRYGGNAGQSLAAIGVGLKTPTSDSGGQLFMDVPAGNGQFAARAGAGNGGGLVVGDSSVTDLAGFAAAAKAAGGGYTVNFDSPDHYTVTGANGQSVLDGSGQPQAGSYSGSGSISFNGLTLAVSGTPAAGDSVGIEAGACQDVFSTLNQLIGALNGSGSSTQLQNVVNRQIESIDRVQSGISNTEAAIGGRLNTLSNQKSVYGDLNVTYQSTLSDVQGVNVYTAISNLSQQSTALQASQQVFAQVKSMSLFNYLK